MAEKLMMNEIVLSKCRIENHDFEQLVKCVTGIKTSNEQNNTVIKMQNRKLLFQTGTMIHLCYPDKDSTIGQQEPITATIHLFENLETRAHHAFRMNSRKYQRYWCWTKL